MCLGGCGDGCTNVSIHTYIHTYIHTNANTHTNHPHQHPHTHTMLSNCTPELRLDHSEKVTMSRFPRPHAKKALILWGTFAKEILPRKRHILEGLIWKKRLVSTQSQFL